MVAAYLINPARRQLPARRADRGGGHRGRRSTDADGLAARGGRGAARSRTSSGSRSSELGLRRLLEEVELPLVEVLCRLERAGVKLDTDRLGEIAAGVADEIERARAARSGSWRARSSRSARRSSSAGSCSRSSGCRSKRRGKTGFSTDARVLRAIRDEHPIVAKVESWRELSKLKSTYFDALPA